MKNNTLAIVGTQWGDEGKGKLTDFFAQKADVVVRWSGGDNAGHTIIFNDKKYKLNIVPSGIFNSKTTNIIANGCVVNLQKLVSEIENLQKQGFDCKNLLISDRAHVIFEYHSKLDEAQEMFRGNEKIGTTKKGIGPCYEDKAQRIGIRIGDLLDKELFREKLERNVNFKNMLFDKIYNIEQVSFDKIYQETLKAFDKIKQFVTNTSLKLNDYIKTNKKVLFEGAQGVMLDLDHGTYPFVTSSNPTASSIPTNTGISPAFVNNILGVVKAYSTRVGEGPFPTEFDDSVSQDIRIRGNEFGTVSKRPRRIGWFDSVLIQHTLLVSGINKLSIMLLDVLTGVKTIKICTSYKLNGKKISYIPSTIKEYEKCEVEYIEMPGWTEDISKVTSFDQLPKNAQNYLKKIEDILKVKIVMFSVGRDRLQTIKMEEIF
ncbi:adenylosuccinate synthase [Spiroplasma endosymbiont of Anurida maritima]|uniref:adenylosuccinate synthase n=1 Tax=Spiroplasma endosymbiont of Anurida maritima TaxID=2967972 RepID=UPI0036D33444